jgi:hypothetical protein
MIDAVDVDKVAHTRTDGFLRSPSTGHFCSLCWQRYRRRIHIGVVFGTKAATAWLETYDGVDKTKPGTQKALRALMRRFGVIELPQPVF